VSNKLTGAFRDAVRLAFNDIGGHEAFSRWAQDNQTEFYRIASRLIPGEMQENKEPIRVVLYGPNGNISPVGVPPTNTPPLLLGHSADDDKDTGEQDP
jgi:hypothetical protein